MAITDNKVTATPTTTGVGSAGDLLTGSTPAELAANKAIFDAFPDAIKTALNDLIDYIDVKPFYYESSVAAATANKGSFSGWIPRGAIIDLILTNGNTSAAPTMTIDSTVYAISNLPTVAKLTTSTAQVYKLRKTGNNTLSFVAQPDYTCEYGVSGAGWIYERRARGKCSCYLQRQAGSQTFTASGGVFVSPDITANFPTGLFDEAPTMTGGTLMGTASIGWISDQVPTKDEGVYKIVKTTSDTADLYHTVKYEGRWR